MKGSIEALQKLFNGWISVPSAKVQTLLDETRAHRNVWLREAVSIDTIIKENHFASSVKAIPLCWQ